MLFHLPKSTSVKILCYWLDIHDFVLCDSAFCNKNTRKDFTTLIESEYFTLEQCPDEVIPWIIERKIKLKCIDIRSPISNDFAIVTKLQQLRIFGSSNISRTSLISLINQCPMLVHLEFIKVDELVNDILLQINPDIIKQLRHFSIDECAPAHLTQGVVLFLPTYSTNLIELSFERSSIVIFENDLVELCRKNNDLQILNLDANVTELQTPFGELLISTLSPYCPHLIKLHVNKCYSISLDIITKLISNCHALERVYLHITANQPDLPTYEDRCYVSEETGQTYAPYTNDPDCYFMYSNVDPTEKEMWISSCTTGNNDFQLTSSSLQVFFREVVDFTAISIDRQFMHTFDWIEIMCQSSPNILHFTLANCEPKLPLNKITHLLTTCNQLTTLNLGVTGTFQPLKVTLSDVIDLFRIPNVLTSITISQPIGLDFNESVLKKQHIIEIIKVCPLLTHLAITWHGETEYDGVFQYFFQYMRDREFHLEILYPLPNTPVEVRLGYEYIKKIGKVVQYKGYE